VQGTIWIEVLSVGGLGSYLDIGTGAFSHFGVCNCSL